MEQLGSRSRLHVFNASTYGKALTFLLVSMILISCGKSNEVDKEEAQRFYRSAVTYEGQGQFHAAIIEARNAIQKNPDSDAGYVLLAKIYNKVGSYEASQKLLEPIVKDMPGVGLELSESYISSNKFRSAINALSQYQPDVAKDPKSAARKQVILAECAIRLGDKVGYENALNELKKIPETSSEVLASEGQYFLSLGNKEKAQEKFDQLVKGKDVTAKTYLLVGSFELQQNQLAKAEDYFTKALGLLSNTDVMTIERRAVLSQLTEALIQQGRTSEAYRYQKLLADANPEGVAAQQKFNDALELYRQSKFSEAEKLLAEIREQFPRDKNSAMLLGLVQFQQGQDGRAIELFDKYIDTETASSTLIQTAALAKFRAKKMDEAVELLKKSVDSQPNNADILATYGLALLDLDPTSSDGQKAIEKSLAINPDKHRLRLSLARRHFVMNNVEQGLAQLKTAYKAAPLDFVLQEAYLKALMQNGKNEEVKQEIAIFQKENPSNPRSFFIDGWFKLVAKDYAGAENAFVKALSLKDNQEKSLSYSGLVELYQTQKQPQKAINTLQLLIAEDPTNISTYAKWYQLARELKREQEAKSFLVDLESKTDKWQPSAVLAQILLEQQPAEAIKYVEHALLRSANSANVKQLAANIYHNYGIWLAGQKKIPEAKIQLLKALNLYPQSPQFLLTVIRLELTQKNFAEAQKLLDQYTETKENQHERLFMQAIIRSAEGKADEAMELYKKSWAVNPTDAVAEVLYQQYQQKNQKDDAEKLLNEWVQKLPQSYNAALLQAISAQSDKKNSDAIRWYEKAIEIAPNMPIPLNNLAWMYYEANDERALAHAEKAATIAPNVGPILDTYGWILVEKGQVQKGIEVLKKALELAPDNAEIRSHYERATKMKKN